MTHMYTIDHSRITGYLQNFDPIKQYFCPLPYNDTSKPIIVPQEYLIHFDDFLLPCNVPIIIAKTLTVIEHLISAPLNDKEISTKQSYQNKLIHKTNYCSFPLKSLLSWSRQKRPNLKHNIPLLKITLRNHQQPLLTNSTMFLHHELSMISLTNLNHTKRILRILHLQHSHTFVTAMITLSKYYNHWTLIHSELLNHPKQYRQQ